MLWKLDLYTIILFIPVYLISISVHEYAHGRMADFLGDPTPRFVGRLTLDPRAHIELFGLLSFLLAGFGWAKPVPVNPQNFKKNQRLGMLLVGIAGPLSNIVVALIFSLVLRGMFLNPILLVKLGNTAQVLYDFIVMMIFSNVSFAVFNMLPVPPLDGSRVLAGILPERFAQKLDQWEYSGIASVVLLVLVFSGLLSQPIGLITRSILRLMGL